jgi:hypothetical protein
VLCSKEEQYKNIVSNKGIEFLFQQEPYWYFLDQNQYFKLILLRIKGLAALCCLLLPHKNILIGINPENIYDFRSF